ncbi:MAG: hypothetical protein Q8R56_06125 [Polaromonas sp.]|nr:hypothetical protein [Polaromonas sp.]
MRTARLHHIAPDPDIAPNYQCVSFSAESRRFRWRMDGNVFAIFIWFRQ